VSKGRQAIQKGQITVLAIISIALVATLAVPTNAYLPWLIFGASGSAPLGFHGVENRTLSCRDPRALFSPVRRSPDRTFENQSFRASGSMPYLAFTSPLGSARPPEQKYCPSDDCRPIPYRQNFNLT